MTSGGYEEIISLAESVPAGSEQLLFLPYLNAERLARKSNSRAQFFGLTSDHGACAFASGGDGRGWICLQEEYRVDESARISLRSDGRCRRWRQEPAVAGNQGKHLQLPDPGSFRAGMWRGRLRDARRVRFRPFLKSGNSHFSAGSI